jgi:hypothetical protein
MMDTLSFKKSSIVLLFAVSIAVSGIGSSVVIVSAASGSSGDAGDTRVDATKIDVGTNEVSGKITAGDVDWYAVELEKGQDLSVRFTSPGNEGVIFRVGLYDPDGKRIAVRTTSRGSQTPVAGNSTGAQPSLSLGHTIQQSGIHYVRITTDSNKPGKRPYALTVIAQSSNKNDSTPSPDNLTSTPSSDNHSSTPSPDNNDSTPSPDNNDSSNRRSQAVPLTSGKTIKGSMTGDSREYFSIRVEAGDVISIETTFSAPSKSSSTVYVYGPGGKRIHTAKSGDIERITIENGGIYTIMLVSDGTSKIDYTLTATVSSVQSSTTSRVRHIKTSQTIKGSISSRKEIDWYAVELKKGQGFTVRLEHTNRKSPSTQMSFTVYNPNRKRIGEAPFDRPRRAYRTSPAAASAYGGDIAKRSGTYYIGVRGKNGAEYSLTVDTVKLDTHDPNEQPASATSISVGRTVSGVLTGYDRDVYAVDLKKGESVTVEYNSTGAIQPSLWMAGPRVVKTAKPIADYSFGKYTIASSGSGNSLTFTANRTGTYYIKVVPYFERSTAATFFESATYEVSVRTSDGSKRVLTVNQFRTSTVAPSTATVALNTSVRTATQIPTPTSTRTPTATQTSATTAMSPTTRTKQSMNENGEMPAQTTATDGPGFGVLLALVGFSGGAWWYRSRQE